ncbi:CidA/LrgA family protein [Allobacillus sp. GCM10007489]|uniref:CidA/LrgA family protein n=1 Tax=unclassified Allobacillus TaxID=2628859 RepID=UPI00164261C9|nr:CidA/LrgA family protein [Allobacillus sp. SKP2-8]
MITYILGILLVIGFYLLGETVHEFLLPWLPGSIIGMVLLFGVFVIFGDRLVRWVKEGAELFIRYLPLFFVPVTVGVLQYEHLVSWFGLAFFALLFISSLFVMLFVAIMMDRKAGDSTCG